MAFECLITGTSVRRPRCHTVVTLAIAASLNLAMPALAAADSAEAKMIFRKRCTACHTFGKGIKVGPDLKGVNERRKPDWLLKFIHASSNVIKSGDTTATSLFAE